MAVGAIGLQLADLLNLFMVSGATSKDQMTDSHTWDCINESSSSWRLGA